jgi:hypothetical protein
MFKNKYELPKIILNKYQFSYNYKYNYSLGNMIESEIYQNIS